MDKIPNRKSTCEMSCDRNADYFKMRKKMCLPLLLAIVMIVIGFCSCKKFVNVDPPITSVNSGNVYGDDATAIAAVTNVYAKISSTHLPGGGITSLSLFPGLSADELSLNPGSTNNAVNYYYTNSLSSLNLNSPDFWAAFYQTIFPINAAIEGISSSNSLTAVVKQQLTGEIKFMRALCYFYLVNLYGDVPLALGSNYAVNAQLSREGKDKVYQQIISDLKEAENLLSPNYLNGTLLTSTSERVRPTKWAASFLLARVYLFTDDYPDAESEASIVIGNTALFSITTLNNAFLKNNSEAIWQLQPVNAGWNTEDARTFILPTAGPDAANYSFYLSPQLVNSFEIGDQRRINWIDSVKVGGATYYYPAKYKNSTFNNAVTEYETVFRLGEQYLIRAEARAQQGKINDAQTDLNAIRSRAGLPDTKANDRVSLLSGILHERQVELFTEWGHRWLDLKRTGNIDFTMAQVAPQKGGTWNTSRQWYPISSSDLKLNHNLVQNAGY